MPEAYPTAGPPLARGRSPARGATELPRSIVPSEATAIAVRAAGVGIGEDRLVIVAEGPTTWARPIRPRRRRCSPTSGWRGPTCSRSARSSRGRTSSASCEAYAEARAGLPEPWPLVVVGPSGWGRTASMAELGSSPGVVFAGEVERRDARRSLRRCPLLRLCPDTGGLRPARGRVHVPGNPSRVEPGAELGRRLARGRPGERRGRSRTPSSKLRPTKACARTSSLAA